VEFSSFVKVHSTVDIQIMPLVQFIVDGSHDFVKHFEGYWRIV